MTLLLAVIGFILLAPAGFVALSLIYDLVGLSGVKKEISALDISREDKDDALDCMERAWRTDWRTRLFDVYAPLVMALVLPFVKRDANQLPRLFAAWDNNISLNGDSGGVYIPADHPEIHKYSPTGESVWVGYRDITDWEAVKDCLQVTYDDERYQGDAYYAKGHHPRSLWARWIWVGLRNRASKRALEHGDEVKEPIELLSGDTSIGTAKAGHFLLRSGDTYHFKSSTPFTLLGFPLTRIRSYGFKLEIAHKMPDQADRVAVVAIGWSAKRWKG